MWPLKHGRKRRSAARVSAIMFVLLVAVSAGVLLLTYHGLRVQSWLRAYTTGESLWSKAQKDAVVALLEYAETGDADLFRQYEREILVPLGDRIAREQLELAQPDLELAYRGFIQGRNHPDDVAGLATLFRRFRNVSYMNSAIAIWTRGDAAIAELAALADELRVQVQAGARDTGGTRALVARILGVNARLSDLEQEFSATLGDGARWLHRVLTAVIVGGGCLALLIVSVGCWLLVRDVKHAESSLVASESGLRSIIENATLGIYRASSSGELLAVNPALVRMLGYASATELMTVPAGSLYAEGVELGAAREHGESVWRKKDGTSIVVRLSRRAPADGRGDNDGMPVLVEDVTERRQLEDQLRQAQKMEALGRLTGGIAHDLNNLLTAVAANADLLAMRGKNPHSDAREALDDLRDATRRASQLIQKLLAFGRRQTLALRSIDLSRALPETVHMLERLLPEHIELATRVVEPLPSVAADPGAVQQMLVNLATNARDAMPGGGKLGISLERAVLSPEFCASRGWGRPGEYVRLAVTDTGVGMSDEVKRHVFEPFFTTKPPGVGTGLGMAMVYGLTKQHDGFVDIESDPGAGTTAALYFPVAAQPASEPCPVEREDSLDLALGAGERVLVVEDNASVRRAVVRQLHGLDYAPLEAADGAEALLLLEQHGEDVDLVITDVMMPKMSGPELHSRLRELGVDVPIVFMSGYPRGDWRTLDRDPNVPLLHKPWTAHEFAAAIRGALDPRRRS